MRWFEDKDGSIVIDIRVVPRASKDGIAGVMGDGVLKVRIQAPPVEGKANAYLIRYLSRQWKVPRNQFEIITGETGRNKRLRIANPSTQLRQLLRALVNK